jgi:hypothetical protein
MYRMLKVAPTDVVQDIVWDHVGRRDVLQPSSIAAPPSDRASGPHRGSGWVDAKPLGKQPGIDLIDQMCEAQTAKERLHSVVEAIEANEAFKRASKQKE